MTNLKTYYVSFVIENDELPEVDGYKYLCQTVKMEVIMREEVRI